MLRDEIKKIFSEYIVDSSVPAIAEIRNLIETNSDASEFSKALVDIFLQHKWDDTDIQMDTRLCLLDILGAYMKEESGIAGTKEKFFSFSKANRMYLSSIFAMLKKANMLEECFDTMTKKVLPDSLGDIFVILNDYLKSTGLLDGTKAQENIRAVLQPNREGDYYKNRDDNNMTRSKDFTYIHFSLNSCSYLLESDQGQNIFDTLIRLSEAPSWKVLSERLTLINYTDLLKGKDAQANQANFAAVLPLLEEDSYDFFKTFSLLKDMKLLTPQDAQANFNLMISAIKNGKSLSCIAERFTQLEPDLEKKDLSGYRFRFYQGEESFNDTRTKLLETLENLAKGDVNNNANTLTK